LRGDVRGVYMCVCMYDIEIFVRRGVGGGKVIIITH
jgi:hypothetical protein